MNTTPSGNRIHIGFFGRRNAGKSSLVNAITGQDLAVVSDVKGTTTDPVYKSMELLPLGPVMIIDTPGFDDEGTLGDLRIRKTRQILNKTDIAVLVMDGTEEMTSFDEEMISLFQEKEIPYLIVYNKMDLNSDHSEQSATEHHEVAVEERSGREGISTERENNIVRVSAKTGQGIYELKECLANRIPADDNRFQIVGDLLHPGDPVILVVPIDSAAPKGRLILPQQQVIRDILESGAVAVVVKDTEYKQTLDQMARSPYMVITDSQVFEQVAKETPEDIRLTSFSILMARKKGFLEIATSGVKALDELQDGDPVLIAEGCTHHRQCDDIGTVKLPNWIREYTDRKPSFTFCSGTEFPDDLSGYKLIIHCGSCMLNEKEVRHRMQIAVDQKIPFTNYGTAIAYMKGILERSVKPILG